MTLTETETRTVPASEVVANYVLLDQRVKTLTAARDELKPAALEALKGIGGSTELQGYLITRVDPTLLKVDLAVLKDSTSWYLFNKLTKRQADLEVVKHYIGAEQFSARALKAISYEDGTPSIRITQR